MVNMRGLLAVFLVVCGAGCAMKRPAETAAPPETSPPPVEVEAPAPIVDHEPIYTRAAEYQALYRDGIELIVSGEEVAGEERIVRATNGLLSEAERCAGLEGCDVGVFFGAFDGLLAEQAIAMKRQALRVSELEQLDQDLGRMYAEEYTRSWRELLQDLRIVRFRSVQHALEVLEALSGQRSPIRSRRSFPAVDGSRG